MHMTSSISLFLHPHSSFSKYTVRYISNFPLPSLELNAKFLANKQTSETAVTPTEVGPKEPDVAAEAPPASYDDGPEPEPQDLENIKSQKSFSSAGSRKSAVTTPSVKSTRSKKSVQARSDHTDPDQTSLELPKSGPVSRASQTSSGKTSKRLTPSTDLRPETSSVSATSGLRSSLEVPQVLSPLRLESCLPVYPNGGSDMYMYFHHYVPH